METGLNWLIERVQAEQLQPAPIGFYFAKLWYHERLYPLIYATGALGMAVRGADSLPSRTTGQPDHASATPAPP